ncbi:MAG: Sb-PDE family phosphodiesterase [Pseudomonadales bacterium]|nr:Sb-PDE family phosphodiesterase [Pseudomonadales bacterium]MDG1443502.1 Sb-PDE family phosphodiesterase [Pseudomonadales bacterium]
MSDTLKSTRQFWAASILWLASVPAMGHGVVPNGSASEREIHFPDVDGYETLTLDLHTHSVFSDGKVWPTIRIDEAERDGLDGIAITEHLEWQPHIMDIPHPDRNRSFEVAAIAAEKLDLLVIPGIEITRNDQVGHMNALFVKDANELVQQRNSTQYLPEHQFETEAEATEFAKAASAGTAFGAHQIEDKGHSVWVPFADKATYLALVTYAFAAEQSAAEVLSLANDQGAFTFWNHPDFSSPRAKIDSFHKEQVRAGRLHGIEIANGSLYYENALRLALKHKLALIGTSDVHDLIDWDYAPEDGGHRPVTLVFATSKTNDAAKEALFAQRTVVWWENTLIGRPTELDALLQASLNVQASVWSGSTLKVTLVNDSDANFQLRNLSDHIILKHGPIIKAAANATTVIEFHLAEQPKDFEMKFEVMNTLVAPNKPANIEFDIQMETLGLQ